MINKARKELPIYYILPLLLIAAIVPLIVHLKVITLDSISFQYWTGQKQNADFFSFYKAMSTIALAVLSLILFLYARYKNIIASKQLIMYYLPIFTYAILVTLSAAFSKYPLTANNGFVDRYEGVYVLIAYIVILFTSINLVNSEKAINVVLAGLFVSAAILGTIGIFQFFGMDLFNSSLGRDLILPGKYRDLDLTFNFGKYNIYSSLYNTNYVGSYAALLFPLSLAAFLYVKKPYFKISTGILTCLMFADWVGCRSRAGYMGGTVAILLLIIFMRSNVKKNYKTIVPLFLSFILIFVGMDSYAGGVLSKRVLLSLSQINDYSAVQSKTGVPKVNLRDITVSGNKAAVICAENTLNIEYSGNQLIFTDTSNKELIINSENANTLTFTNKGYEPYQIRFDLSQHIIEVKINSSILDLYLDDKGFKIMGERGVLLDKIDHPESIGFAGRERFASSRGYIWSRSIPLLKNNILIGGGPDTYAMQFPQHDFVGKLKALDMTTEIVDKPHNMYLQIGINTGVLSLLALLFLFAVYLITSIRMYLNVKTPSRISLIGASLFCAVAGYLVAGLANDSIVSVAPVFWIVLGMGISCNYMIKHGLDKQDADRLASNKKVPNRK